MLPTGGLIQEHRVISRIIFIFDNISVNLKSFSSNRFLKFKIYIKKNQEL